MSEEVDCGMFVPPINYDKLYDPPEQKKTICPYCGKEVLVHIVKDGARFHVLFWDSYGTHCSEPNCEENHGRGKCVPDDGKKPDVTKKGIRRRIREIFRGAGL